MPTDNNILYIPTYYKFNILSIIQGGHIDVNSVTPGSQTVGETRASLYATEPLMQCSEAAQLFTFTHTHTHSMCESRESRVAHSREKTP